MGDDEGRTDWEGGVKTWMRVEVIDALAEGRSKAEW